MASPLRLGLFYSALFAGAGVAAPYIPVWFAHQGLSGAQIGVILSAPMIGRLITAPAIAMWADGLVLRRTALIMLALACALAYALMAAPFGFWWWLAIWFCASSLFATLPPLTDIIVLRHARESGFNYGWPRGIGSVAFIFANVVAGALLARFSPEVVLPWIITTALLSAIGARGLLPPDRVGEAGAPTPTLSTRLSGMGALIANKTFLLTVGSVGLIQSAHAFYYSFSALSWKQQGIAENLTGMLWGVGVAVEVGFMWFMEPWRRRVGPHRLLVLGGVAAVIRWTAMAFSPPLWALYPLQGLHALTYAATFLASVQLVEQMSTNTNASAAQTINSALSVGVLGGFATIAAGWMFDVVGAYGYLAMAIMAALGLAGALRLLALHR